MRTWETETFPAIPARAKQEGGTIYFADGSGLRSDYRKGNVNASVFQTFLHELGHTLLDLLCVMHDLVGHDCNCCAMGAAIAFEGIEVAA